MPQARAPKPDPAALLRAGHVELRPHLDHLRPLADQLDVSDEPQLRERLERVVWRSCATASWPIRGVEETTVYPAPAKLQRFLGGAIGTMVIAHDLTAGRVAEVGSLAAADRHDAPTRAGLRQSLIGLEAALYGHFNQEDQVYVPLLEHLTPRESDALARQLEHAAVKGHEH